MANLSEDGNRTTVEQLICSIGFYGIHLKIFISALNIPLSVAAFLGNSLIIVAIKKASCLRPPSKLFYICLGATDLCVGIFTQPLVATYYLSPEHSKLCFLLLYLIAAVGAIFCGVSLLTLTAISVDRLLALTGNTIQTGGNSEEGTDSCCCFLASLHFNFIYSII